MVVGSPCAALTLCASLSRIMAYFLFPSILGSQVHAGPGCFYKLTPPQVCKSSRAWLPRIALSFLVCFHFPPPLSVVWSGVLFYSHHLLFAQGNEPEFPPLLIISLSLFSSQLPKIPSQKRVEQATIFSHPQQLRSRCVFTLWQCTSSIFPVVFEDIIFDLRGAEKVLIFMQRRYIQCFVHNHLRLFSSQQQLNETVNRPIQPWTCTSLIKQCGNLKVLKSVHACMLRSHLHLNRFFTTNLITHYTSLGSISNAYSIFSSSQAPDLFLWNVMIQCFVDNASYDYSILLYHQMLEGNLQPDNFTFPFVLKACRHLRDIQVGRMIHAHVLEFGYASDVFVCNALITMYGRCEQYDISSQVFDNMPERTLVSWSAMIGSCSWNKCYEEGLSLFYKMLDERITPNRGAVLNAISCISREDDAYEISKIVVDNGLDLDQSVQNAAMGMYSRCGRIDIAQRIFDGIVHKDMVSWSSMIEAYAKADLSIKALELFYHMKLLGIEIDFVTILSVAKACSSLASFRQARFVHGFIIRNYFLDKLELPTALIDLYVKCGSVKYGWKIFDTMKEKNLISWSTMISGYGMHGRGRDALNLFDQMKCTIKPDGITFVSVLSACSHAGLIDEGWSCFNSMIKDFGMTPKLEHYACMVDLLGRAGRLDEAREFIGKMPEKPDSGVWGALLGACRIHLNVELAELAAKSLFELDAENPGRYVLLSNIYKCSGKKEEADKIRVLMTRRGVKKAAGHTIIEVKNKIYTFVVGDQSNPQTELIYRELEKLMKRIREEGYIPDKNFTLHDVEEEMKEKMLYMHSEKLAIVFGLLNLDPTSVIRIKKNLRVCGDCHSATKFMSKVTEREIVVRDAHRFHHFMDGACSCGDYW